MKKVVSTILAAFCLCAVFASCSKDGGQADDTKTPGQTGQGAQTTESVAAKEIDTETVAKAILAEGLFEGTLDLIDPAALEALYPGLPADAKGTVYMPGVTCADEVAVFTSSDTAALEACVKDHVAEQRAGFASYMPEQVPKLDDAVIVTGNGAVVLVISDDADGARAIVEKALG